MALAGSRLGRMLVMLGLLAMIQQSTQLSLRNPMHDLIDRINLQRPGYIGLVLSSDDNEQALNESNAFIASTSTPYIDKSGRRFHVGKIGAANVIYVKCGSGSVNAALTAQLLADTFLVDGIVYVAASGSVNSSLSVGDVVVPKEVADTGTWTWLKYNTSGTLTKGAKLYIGDYNLPTAGENSLGTIQFDAIQIPSPNGTESVFWLPADASWLKIAEGLQSTLQCAGGSNSNCLLSSSNIAFGLRGVSSSIYVKNAAYGKFLNTQFKAAVVEEGTAPIAVAARLNGQKVIFILGVSNIVGGSESSDAASYSASINAVSFATRFIQSVAAAAQRGHYQE